MKVYVTSILKWDGTTGVQTHVREVFPFLKTTELEPHFMCPHDGTILEKFVLSIFFLLRRIFSAVRQFS